MFNKRRIGIALLFGIAFMPLWGGTGRPSDGLLSFILLLGFLLLVLGILQLAAIAKKWAEEVLEGLY
jgi:uncharacterized protein YfdQ (DUF2303 family)